MTTETLKNILYSFVILFITLIIYTFYTVYHGESTVLTKFFAVIAGVSAIAVSINLIVNTYVQMRDIYDRNQMNMLKNSDYWSNIYKICSENYPYSSRIYQEIAQNDSILKLPENISPTNLKKYENDPEFIEKRLGIEFYISAMCVQVMENFLIFGKYDQGGSYPWIVTYLWWLRSPVIVKYWRSFSSSYGPNTIEFVDSLIEVSQQMPKTKKVDELQEFVNKVKFSYIE